MSAFFDLWVSGDNKPLRSRICNTQWQKTESFYFSLPENNNTEYIQQLSTSLYHLVVLGQFYEPVNIDLLLETCVKKIKGETAFKDPAGHYAIFLFDKTAQQYHVFTNRFGTLHVYWAEGQALSTYYVGLARESRNKELDWEGITGFLGMGFFPGDRTYLKNIKILEPASHYCIDQEFKLIYKKRYWDWHYNPSNHSVTDYSVILNDLLTTSLSHSLYGKKIALPISGGLDSRMLTGIITAGDKTKWSSLFSYSYGNTKNSIETTIAEKVAFAAKIEFQKIIVPDYLFDNIELIGDSVEYFQYIDGTRQACVTDLLKESADIVVGGHWGDVWMDDTKLFQNDSENDDEILTKAFQKKIIKKGSQWLLNNVSENYFSNSTDFLNDYFKSFIQRYRHIGDADFRMKIFKTDQWSFRWTMASTRMYQAAVMPVLPFYDRRIADLFCITPSNIVKDRKLQVEFIKRYYPHLAEITWQEYERNLYNYKGFNNRHVAFRAIKKIQRTITGGKNAKRNAEIFYLHEGGRNKLESNLLGKPVFNDIVSEAKISGLLNAYYGNPSAENSYAVSMLHTLALFVNKVL